MLDMGAPRFGTGLRREIKGHLRAIWRKQVRFEATGVGRRFGRLSQFMSQALPDMPFTPFLGERVPLLK